MAFNTILPGAWELTVEEAKSKLFALYVPTAWRQVASNLIQQRARLQRKSYRSIPVSSLDPLIAGSFPKIIQTVRNGWQKGNVPWLFATESTDISDLGDLIKDWLREEFSCIEDLESILVRLNNSDWHWEEPKTYSLLHPQNKAEADILYQAIPDYLAQEFLKNPVISFGKDQQYQLRFYRVISLQGAELMSWPPYPVVLTNWEGEALPDFAYISFVIRFVLQTVPWREKPIIYHQPSVRRWLVEPLKRLPYRGVKAHIGDNRRWLDGKRQPFCFIPLMIKRQGEEVKWPRAIAELLSLGDSQLPDPITLASNPTYNWSDFHSMPHGIQAAIAYTSQLREAPCLAGISPLDLDSLDRAVKHHLPVKRVGEAQRVSGKVFLLWQVDKPKKKIVPQLAKQENQSNKRKTAKRSDDPNHSHTPMLRPKIAAPAVFRETENPLGTILILWETPQCRDALIAEICQLLYLSPTKEADIYTGSYGSLCIKTQHVGDLTQNLEIKNFAEAGKSRQQQRIDLLQERINKIIAFLPKADNLCGALIEIRPKPFIAEADPKLAWRIGALKAGYLNQHLHRITFTNKKGEEHLKKSGMERIKRAVTDLLRQFGILPDTPLIDPKKDGIGLDTWLTCFYVLRRTRKTNTENIPKTVVLMVRVNPVTAKVEVTTPNLFPQQGWVSYPVALQHLLHEDWDSNSDFGATPEHFDEEQQRQDKEREQRLINKFVADCVQECLNTPITDKKSPRVLFMAEAQNARKMLKWLQNQNLLDNNPLHELKQRLTKEEIDRLWVVRLRVADNGEVPVAIVKDSPGSRTSGVFRWQGECDRSLGLLYLSVRKALNTEKGTNILQQKQSRLDNGSRQAGKARILEMAIVHCPGVASDRLAHFIHSLRSRWPYFANEVSLPFPFPFATKAKEYAVSTRDIEDVEELNEFEVEDR
jgi:hypothetical protein